MKKARNVAAKRNGEALWNSVTPKAYSPAVFERQAPAPKAPVIFGNERTNPACRTPWPRFGKIPYRELSHRRQFPDEILSACRDGLEIMIYCCGCPSLQKLARTYKFPMTKVGCTLVDLRVRQSQLSKDSYGSGFVQDGKHIFEDEAWTDWEMQTAELFVDPHPSSSVTLTPRGLRVRLPTAMTARGFEKSLHRAISRGALHFFARSPIGQEHFAHLGIDPATVPRYVRYNFGNGERISLANEIYICRPREDWSRLKIIAEDIVSDFITQHASQAA
jgi:hypothetical protein